MIAWSRRRCGTALALAVFLTLLAVPAAAAADPDLTIVVSGSGEVDVSPLAVTCSSTCVFSVDSGTTVTLTAKPSFGGRFNAWGGACESATGDTCTLQPSSDVTVTASFAVFRTRSRTVSTAVTETQPPPTTPTTTAPVQHTTTAATGLTPTTPQPKPPTGAAWAAIERATASLHIGSVAFNTPDTLGRGETATIELLVSPSESVAQLKTKITQAGSREGARVEVSDYMKAELAGSDFTIVRIGDERQVVLPDRPTRWAWDITPQRTGVLHLHLTLTALLRVAGENRELDIKTFDRTLTIRVSWIARFKDFVHDNWHWLWTSIFVPVGAWAVRRWKRGSPSPST